MRIIKSILILLFVVAFTAFTVQNMKIVSINFLNWHMKMPLSILSVLIYVLGAVSGGILFKTIKSLSTKPNDTDMETVKENKTET